MTSVINLQKLNINVFFVITLATENLKTNMSELGLNWNQVQN